MSTKYIYTFGLIMTVLVALVLAGFRTITADKAAENEDIFNKREILATVAAPLQKATGKSIGELSDQDVLEIFNNSVEQILVNTSGQKVEQDFSALDLAKEYKKPEDTRVYPVNVFDLDGEAYYVFSVRGNGLWDAIWGNIALGSDLNTVTGASFDHAGETPGLGAEIKDNAGWKSQFKGKKIYDGDKFVSIIVRKGGAVNPDHDVDGLSGATITGDGVTKMLWNGLKAYEPFIEEQRAATAATSMNLK